MGRMGVSPFFVLLSCCPLPGRQPPGAVLIPRLPPTEHRLADPMQIVEGDGWRLVIDPARRPYGALIGGGDWAVELRNDELACLRRGVLTLLAQHRDLLPCLMADEDLDLELDLALPPAAGGDVRAREDGVEACSGGVFVALHRQAGQWSLRFVLTPADGSRAVEGGWTPAASGPLAAALEGLGDDPADFG